MVEKHPYSGKFLVLEGQEGAGLPMQMMQISTWLKETGRPLVIFTPEGRDSRMRGRIRDAMLSYQTNEEVEASAYAYALLGGASIAQGVTDKIKPALERGDIVLAHSFTPSFIVRNYIDRNIRRDDLHNIARMVQGNCPPDMTVLLDTPAEVIAKVHNSLVLPNDGEIAYFERVRQGYLDLAAQSPERIKVVDTTPGVSRVTQEIRSYFEAVL